MNPNLVSPNLNESRYDKSGLFKMSNLDLPSLDNHNEIYFPSRLIYDFLIFCSYLEKLLNYLVLCNFVKKSKIKYNVKN